MVLSGWKEVANYLRLGVRTVQRWESKGLPIHRPIEGNRGHVVAYTAQLDKWVQRQKLMQDSRLDGAVRSRSLKRKTNLLFSRGLPDFMRFLFAFLMVNECKAIFQQLHTCRAERVALDELKQPIRRQLLEQPAENSLP